MGNWENQRGGMVAHSLGRSVHRSFATDLGQAGKTGCKPRSSHSAVHCEILGFKVWMQAGQLELLLQVC